MAIAIGEASTVPWPIILAAFWVSLSAGSTLPKNAGKPVSWSTPSPRAAAAGASESAASLSRWAMKAVLQELASASAKEIFPSAEEG